MIQLFTTSACHLCELAEALLHQAKLNAQTIEIADDDTLIARYGTRIPVLKRTDNHSELNWPFTIEEVRHFIR